MNFDLDFKFKIQNMDYKQNEAEFIRSVDSYLKMLDKVHDIPGREKILYYMFKFINEKKYTINFDKCIMLKSVIHEKLSELYFNYNLLWADELHYDILGKHILEPIIKNDIPEFDELSSIIMNPYNREVDIFPIDKNYTLENPMFDKNDDVYIKNMISEYFSTQVFSDDMIK